MGPSLEKLKLVILAVLAKYEARDFYEPMTRELLIRIIYRLEAQAYIDAPSLSLCQVPFMGTGEPLYLNEAIDELVTQNQIIQGSLRLTKEDVCPWEAGILGSSPDHAVVADETDYPLEHTFFPHEVEDK